jgi:predicted aminopeptidase
MAASSPVRRPLAAALAALALGGCATVEYYSQAVLGQLEVMQRARPIDEVIVDPASSPQLRARLERVREIRAFAVAELGLPDNGAYRGYADLGRPFVVWNVFAAPALSLEPVKSCFPVAGCVTYRGYYAQAAAEAHAASLAAQGFDTYVGGVPAYSTLGWFDDPVLNTFVQYPDAELARLVFHELAHQVVYVKDDTTFNESFATAVELAGVERWLAARGGAAERQAFEAQQARRRDLLALLLEYREKLADAYAADVPEAGKRAAKERLLADLQRDYAAMKQARWGGYAGYDRFFAAGVNNANLASVAAYTALVPAFQALLAQEGGDLPRFYAATKRLAQLPRGERLAALERLAPALAVSPRSSPPG